MALKKVRPTRSGSVGKSRCMPRQLAKDSARRIRREQAKQAERKAKQEGE